MAGRGPLPKQFHQRERDTKRRQADAVTLSPDGEIRGPDLVEATGRDDWHPLTLRWWETWRRSAQAQIFEGTDWSRLLSVALIVEHYHSAPKPSAAALSEIRLNEERLGATYADRLRARIYVEKEREAPALATVTEHPTVSARESVQARLRGAQ